MAQIILKIKYPGRGWRQVKCGCCGQRRVFPSFAKARAYAAPISDRWRATRID